MATYIYMIKGTLRHTEDAGGKTTKLGSLTVKDYVAAVRAGPGYGTEPDDPRGNLVPLARYLKEVQPGPVDTLGLRSSSGARFALLIFGSLDGGKAARGLAGDSSWSRIGTIHAASEPIKCMVADSKFGTGHAKMLMMVGSSQFDFPKGMKEVSLASKGQSMSAQQINQYFQSFR